MILAGDIGGTNTRLAYFEGRKSRLKWVLGQKFRSADFPSLSDILDQFVGVNGLSVSRMCLGIAGPVVNDRVQATNLPWVIDAHEIARQHNLGHVHLINDLVANAHGIETLAETDLSVLNEGDPEASGNRAVISAGTGLGEAGIYFDGNHYHPFGNEGGHCDFAPANDLQSELLLYLRKKHGHVSWERVLSGPAFYTLYDFLRDRAQAGEPDWLAAEFKRDNPSIVVSRLGVEGKSKLCADAVNLFVELYGAEAGNLALKTFALGGLYIGGGIAPKIISKLMEPQFIRAFVSKGRMEGVLEKIPVKVILNDEAALRGAAHCAAEW